MEFWYCILFGIIGLSLALEKSLAEAAALVAAFVPADVIKACIAGMLTSALAKVRPASVLSISSRADAV